MQTQISFNAERLKGRTVLNAVFLIQNLDRIWSLKS